MRKAICLGISAQTDASLDSLPQCKVDVNRVSRFLESEFAKFKVEEYHNSTSTNIKRQLWNGLKGITADDQILIYFSGHGKRNAARKLQLCLHDTEVDALAATSISFDELLQLCNEAGAESTLIVLDCCFSGAAERSILAKGAEEIFSPHEEAILSSKGLSVLSSCNSVELSYIDSESNLSSFTASLLEICDRKSQEMCGWLTVGHLYEEMRFSIKAHHPKLIGNNPGFPICQGRSIIRPNPKLAQEIEFRKKKESYPLLYGILILPYYRSWLVGLQKANVPPHSTKIGQGVYVRYNSEELYSNKIDEVKEYIGNTINQLELLCRKLSTTLLLLYPIAIEKETYNRFHGVDRKYILTSDRQIIGGQYPIIIQQQFGYSISEIDRDYWVHNLPEDYLKDVFGLMVDQSVGGPELLFREDSFSKNAKYLCVEPYTNRVIGAMTFGKNSIGDLLSFSSIIGEMQKFTATVNSLRVHPVRPHSRISGQALIVQSEIQDIKYSEGYHTRCKVCLDEKFRQVRFNTRLYRIPCKACNASYDNTWRAFPDL